ncbi:uncharacterized protein TNCT_99651 [Trichonephila clavata]|uniref:Uncharacterized protein n=1 Tax=Trichonephila clavata TaxID=2740835 RepID=A0A8X6LG40_TRICU|nr:uncharacterized protein TNCT_99651 [Trichonephila clavata]
MFRRKTTLPARPPIPSREEIIDDLTQATTNYVVFKLERKLSLSDNDDAFDLPENLKDADSIGDKEFQNPDQSYIMVAAFMEKVDQLEKYLIGLEKSKEKLKLLEENLLSDIAKVEEEVKKRSET